MLKLIGGCMAVAGAVGAGIRVCMDRRRRIAQLTALEKAFSLIAGEISYSRACLPEILTETGQRLRESFEGAVGFGGAVREDTAFLLGNALGQVGRRLEDGSGQDMQRIWTEEMGEYLSRTAINRREKGLVLSFPDTVYFLDGLRQEAAVREFADRMGEAAASAKLSQKQENRITMAFCIALSLMAVIVLW